MGLLDFIFGLLLLVVVFFIGIGAIAMKWNTENLEQENEELKKKMEDLRKKGAYKHEKKTK